MDSPREKEIKAHDRQLEALALRKAGVQYADIATKLGYRAASGAWRAVRAALKKTLQEPAEELRVLAEARLDAMLLAIWPQVAKGSHGAIDRALRIEQRRAELRGLDAPTKTFSIDYTKLTDDQLDRIIAGENVLTVLTTNRTGES